MEVICLDDSQVHLVAELSKKLSQKSLNQVNIPIKQTDQPTHPQPAEKLSQPYIDPNAILHYPVHSDNPGLEVKAWLVGETLHIQGVLTDLEDAIIRLTTNNLPLQRKLLRKHVGVYSNSCWPKRVETWQKNVATLVANNSLSQEEAEYQAAESLRAVAFLEDLKAS